MSKDATHYQIQAYRLGNTFLTMPAASKENEIAFKETGAILREIAAFIEKQALEIETLRNEVKR
jgi:hypothetical protein